MIDVSERISENEHHNSTNKMMIWCDMVDSDVWFN